METTEILIIPAQLDTAIAETKIERSKAEQHAIAFAPSMQSYLEIAETIKKMDKINPSDMDAKMARENRLKLVKIRTGAEEIKDLRKEGIRAEGDLIQALFNVVKNSCLVTETEFTEIEKHQERLEEKRKSELAESRKALLAPFGTDTEYLPLGTMTDEQFTRCLENESLAFNARKEQAEKAEVLRIETERLAEEARRAQIKKDAEEREAQRLENIRLQKENEEKQKQIESERIIAEKKQAELSKQAERDLQEKQKQQDRQSAMFGLGLQWDGQMFHYQDINFHWTDLLCMNDADFEKAYKGASKRMEILKAEKLKKEQADKELSDKLATELKAKQDAEAKIEADKKAALVAPDKEKINNLYLAFKNVELPICDSKEADALISKVAEKVRELLMFIKIEAKNLK